MGDTATPTGNTTTAAETTMSDEPAAADGTALAGENAMAGGRQRGSVIGWGLRAAAIASAIAAVALAVGCGDARTSRTVALGADTDRGTTGQYPQAGDQILLEALGTGTADIAYAAGDEQVQEAGVALPWQKTFRSSETSGPFSIMVVSGQRDSIGCRITIANKLVNEAVNDGTVTPDGTGTIVSCRTD